MQKVRNEAGFCCVPACVSMITGIPLDDLLTKSRPDAIETYGYFLEEFQHLLLTEGWMLTIWTKHCDSEDWEFTLDLPRLNQPAVICGTLKDDGKLHAMVWDGSSRYLDPDTEHDDDDISVFDTIHSVGYLTRTNATVLDYF